MSGRIANAYLIVMYFCLLLFAYLELSFLNLFIRILVITGHCKCFNSRLILSVCQVFYASILKRLFFSRL